MRKQNSKFLTFSACCWMILSLVGCGAFTFLGFGKASVNLQPSKTMNVDDNGNPLPTVVRIYQLKSKYKMDKADFKSLWKNDKVLLDDDLLEKKEITVYPGKKQEIKIEKKDDAKYIGIVAIFRKPNEEQGKWKYTAEFSSWNLGSQDIDIILGKDNLKIGVLEEEKKE